MRLALLLLLAACGAVGPGLQDAGAGDAGGAVAGDGGGSDAGEPDAGGPGSADGGPGPTDAGVDAGRPLRVLFVGNSYTYVNDLPGVLEQLAASAGVTVRTESVVEGGATLDVHWANGTARARIQDGGFTHVVLQGQSVEPLFVTDAFVFSASRFAAVAVDAGAVPAWYVTWARAPGPAIDALRMSREEMQDRLSYSYGRAAAAWPGSVLACVGEAFRASTAERPGLDLYDPDGSHPSLAGTYLAASTFFVALTGRTLPSGAWAPPALLAEDAAFLRAKAAVGSACADVRVRASVSFVEYAGALYPDAGPPFEYLPSAIPVAHAFLVTNQGKEAAVLSDGLGLTAPFRWTSGAYPGGAGRAKIYATEYPYCGASLAGGASCVVSVTYSGAADGVGQVRLGVSGGYAPTAWRALSGTRAEQPTLRLEGPADPQCAALRWYACATDVDVMRGAPTHLLVVNAGASPAPGPITGTLTGAFSYGATGDGGAFPGGAGSVTVGGTSYEFCGAGDLAPGQRCAVRVDYDGPGEDLGQLAVAFTVDAGTVDGGLHVPATFGSPHVRTLRGLVDAGP